MTQALPCEPLATSPGTPQKAVLHYSLGPAGPNASNTTSDFMPSMSSPLNGVQHFVHGYFQSRDTHTSSLGFRPQASPELFQVASATSCGASNGRAQSCRGVFIPEGVVHYHIASTGPSDAPSTTSGFTSAVHSPPIPGIGVGFSGDDKVCVPSDVPNLQGTLDPTAFRASSKQRSTVASSECSAVNLIPLGTTSSWGLDMSPEIQSVCPPEWQSVDSALSQACCLDSTPWQRSLMLPAPRLLAVSTSSTHLAELLQDADRLPFSRSPQRRHHIGEGRLNNESMTSIVSQRTVARDRSARVHSHRARETHQNVSSTLAGLPTEFGEGTATSGQTPSRIQRCFPMAVDTGAGARSRSQSVQTFSPICDLLHHSVPVAGSMLQTQCGQRSVERSRSQQKNRPPQEEVPMLPNVSVRRALWSGEVDQGVPFRAKASHHRQVVDGIPGSSSRHAAQPLHWPKRCSQRDDTVRRTLAQRRSMSSPMLHHGGTVAPQPLMRTGHATRQVSRSKVPRTPRATSPSRSNSVRRIRDMCWGLCDD
uniref:Uncharacterized protein n=1 Tax=Noctiluca scintillans TaxID=2966 RepID=A0A7S1AZI0_NOCSC|mmetsp:Transcript_6472/g.18084  ORF Transcript_6472/g.18084 Transcript_6472/m.18084 type:complete len:536 (+) Transcript_6472:98-1705(+)